MYSIIKVTSSIPAHQFVIDFWNVYGVFVYSINKTEHIVNMHVSLVGQHSVHGELNQWQIEGPWFFPGYSLIFFTNWNRNSIERSIKYPHSTAVVSKLNIKIWIWQPIKQSGQHYVCISMIVGFTSKCIYAISSCRY